MPAPTPVNSPSRSLPSTPPKKETEPAHSATSEAGDATTPTAKSSNAAKTTDPEATPKNVKRYSSAPDPPPTTPSAQHGSIAAWGSTSGKLYLSGPPPDHANSVSGVWESVFGLRPKKATEQGDDAEKKAEKAEKVEDHDGDKSGEVD
ncbi:uncharacterized protein Z520_04175 [Fonsecaea multimorphosa CBS 102226]|uniref:Uncharacterized protein n=1 Tax=Fonsecaea multimorphosa CBS 102226 TaxID=1442371 RepID=A0A0D2KBK0_9EURO|nr:uncharacterized protein Z520_04175 [Fonsecaea multimorphosa CBS 102226]KIY00490.1 hypothetical protein Z520_04175 [Fonsecaea multimorphosa CBS 102226]OAL27004.1 hypothetical protein AYO22_03948 [Fonsecaea multimorphosa]